MKIKSSKVLSTLLALVMAFGLFAAAPLTANADEGIIAEQPKDATIDEGEGVSFYVSIYEDVSGAKFQWYVDDGSGWVPVPEVPPYGSSTNYGLSLHDVPASFDGNQYRCKVEATYYGAYVELYSEIATLTVIPVSSAGMDNFTEENTYEPGQFTDVNENAWYGSANQNVIASAFAYGLMKGDSATSFDPNGDVTIAQAITIAVRVHSIYSTGTEDFVEGFPWYQVYVDYAVDNELINADDFADYKREATRAEMAYIFSRSLPSSEFEEQNTVNALPDVNSGTPYFDAILTLYTAGIVERSDGKGTFNPGSNITRAEAAATISRVILPGTRFSENVFG